MLPHPFVHTAGGWRSRLPSPLLTTPQLVLLELTGACPVSPPHHTGYHLCWYMMCATSQLLSAHFLLSNSKLLWQSRGNTVLGHTYIAVHCLEQVLFLISSSSLLIDALRRFPSHNSSSQKLNCQYINLSGAEVGLSPFLPLCLQAQVKQVFNHSIWGCWAPS